MVRPDNVGDVVLLTPALRALRAAAPQARIELLASPAGTAVAAMIPELDGVLTVSPSWQQLTAPTDAAGAAAAVRAERELLDRLTAGRYDVMLVFTSFSQSPWPVTHLGLLAGITTRSLHSREFAGAVATHWVTPPPDTTHHVDRSLHLLASIGVPLRDDTVTAHPGRGPRGRRRPGRRRPRARRRTGRRTRPRSGPWTPRRGSADGSPCSYRERRARRGATRRRGSVPPRPRSRRGPPGARRRYGGGGRPRRRGRARGRLPGRPGPARHRPARVHRAGRPRGRRAHQQLRGPAPRRRRRHAGRRHLRRHRAPGDVAPRAVPSALLHPVPCSPCRQLRCPFHLECLDVAPRRLAEAALRLAASAARPVPDHPVPDHPVADIPEEDRWPHDPATRIA